MTKLVSDIFRHLVTQQLDLNINTSHRDFPRTKCRLICTLLTDLGSMK